MPAGGSNQISPAWFLYDTHPLFPEIGVYTNASRETGSFITNFWRSLRFRASCGSRRRMQMLKKSIWVSVAVLCLVCGFTIPTASGQAVYGSITGSVTDAQGSGVAGAKVLVTNVTKGTTEETTTNDSGIYSVTHLIPDTYKIRVEASGFKSYEIASVRVDVDSTVRADAQL